MSIVARVRSRWIAFLAADNGKLHDNPAAFPNMRCRLRLVGGCLSLGLACLNLSPALRAQTATGSIAGSIKDPSGAAITGATVRLTNVATNEARTTQSNDLGYYSFPLTPSAVYNLEVEARGFKRFVQENVKLDVGLAKTLDAKLAIGQSSEVVTVTAQLATIENSTASLGQVIGNQTITNLPLNGRNSYSFAQLVPGVRASQGFGQVAYGMYNDQFVSVNGSRPNQSSFLLDGGANSETAFNGPGYFPNVDLVQEYKVQTNNYSAEFSNTAGGVINVVTKSGSNQIHGSAYEFLRNDKLTATDFFVNGAGGQKGTFRFNQFGGTAGGPIKKDRTFFFGSYEGLRWISGVTAVGTMPTALQRTGNFSQTYNQQGQQITIFNPFSTQAVPGQAGIYTRNPVAGNVIPANLLDPVALNLLKYMPAPNTAGNPITGTNNFVSNYSAPINKNDFSGRIDHAINDQQKIFGRVSVNRTIDNRPPLYGASNAVAAPTAGNDRLLQTQDTINYSNVLSPSLVLELSSSYLRYSIQRDIPGINFNPTQVGLPAYFNTLAQVGTPCFPNVGISGLGVSVATPDVGGGLLGGGCYTLHDAYETFHETGNLTYVHGAHTFKMGADFGVKRLATGRNQPAGPSFGFDPGFTQGPNPLASSSTAGVGLASFLFGTGSGSTSSSGGPGQNLLLRYFGGYFQDDWKITSKLTLNLGLRYDYTSPWTERYNRISDWNYYSPSPVQVPGLNLKGGLEFPGSGALPRGQYDPDPRNIAPRFGFAFAADSNTAIRGGFGLFYAPTTGGGFNGNAVPISGFQASTPWVSTLDGVTPVSVLSNPFPNGFIYPTGSSLAQATLLGQGVVGMDRKRVTPYTEQWNFDIQRGLPGGLLVDVAYAGSHGIALYGDLNINQLPNQYLGLGNSLNSLVTNPFYGVISSGSISGSTVRSSQLLRPYPQFTAVTIGNQSYGQSIYHALQAKLERRFANGFNLLVSYTWSKLIDDVGATTTGFPGESFSGGGLQDYYNLRGERALATFDTPHYLAVNSVWELPFGRNRKFLNRNGFVDAVLGGWQLNGLAIFHTGVPLQLTTASNNLFNYGGTERPNWNGQDPTRPGSIESRLNNYFNAAAFSQPAPFTFGNTARTIGNLRGPGQANMDLSIIKNFVIHEQIRLQFRAESFNTLNHPQFGLPNVSIGTSSAGVISTQQNKPRDIQFALKLLF
jgi:hypothetical protein